MVMGTLAGTTRKALTFTIAAAVAFSILSSTAATAAEFDLHVPVLMYHRITKAPSDARLPHLWVSPKRFKRQLRELYRRGWRTMTAEELAGHLRRREPVGRKRFVITFDDGARDDYTNAFPVLEELDMHATYCLTPGRAHKPWQISFKHMRRLVDAGHEIASHSLTHADLPSLGNARLRKQIRGAQRLIEEKVGTRPVTMCYPFGRHDPRVHKVASRAGIFLGFTTVDGARQAPSNRLRSPQIRINGSDTPADVVRKLRPYKGSGWGIAAVEEKA
jgi:peptidoglycan/xylan/chitin deacetylase (PgdA/CDA1 family)